MKFPNFLQFPFHKVLKMSTVKTLQKKIYLDSKFLGPELIDKLKETLRHELQDTCSKEHGYILNLKSIGNIKSESILSDCCVYDDRIVPTCQSIFNVTCKVETFKPEVDVVSEGTVFAVLPTGVLLKHHDRQKVLIPAPIAGYTYDGVTSSFKGEDQKSIGIGDKRKVKFRAVKYSDKNFTVFGTLVE